MQWIPSSGNHDALHLDACRTGIDQFQPEIRRISGRDFAELHLRRAAGNEPGNFRIKLKAKDNVTAADSLLMHLD